MRVAIIHEAFIDIKTSWEAIPAYYGEAYT